MTEFVEMGTAAGQTQAGVQRRIRPRRSVLYLPASNKRAIDKARSLSCDAIVLDLEDAVAPEAKAEARLQAVEAAREGGFGSRELIIRINGLDTPWGLDDIAALALAGYDALLVPKVRSAVCIERFDAVMKDYPASVALWAMIETAPAFFKLEEIANCASRTRLSTFVLGTNDLLKELRARATPGRSGLISFLAMSVAAARIADISVIDGVFNDLEDVDGLTAECRQGVDLGFDGKTLIHPSQIEPCNTYFTPDVAAGQWAQKIVDAFARPENAGKGALKIDGKMVERLHLEGALRDLAIIGMINSR